MAIFDTLGEVVAKVLFDNHGAAIAVWILSHLETFDVILQGFEGVIFGVSYKEGEIDGSMRVVQFLYEFEIGFQV